MDIRLLGPVTMATSGQVVDIGRPQRCLALAALAVDVGKLVLTDTLVNRIWDFDPPAKARRSLHAHLSGLRRLFADHRDDRPPARILSHANGYALDLAAERVDIFCFRELREKANAAGDEALRLCALREALALWRGEPLAGLDSQWADQVRQLWRREHREVVLAWAASELSRGNPVVVVEPLWRELGDDLHDQRLVATLMQALYATGDPNQALALYQSAYDQIVKNHGLEIGPDLVRVQLGVLRGDLEVVTSRPVLAGGRRGRAPVMVGSMPPRADGFQDRALFDELRAATEPGRTTVLTQVVAGLGGVGKTQLAAEFARRLSAAGEVDLVVWVSALSRDSVVSGYVQAGSDLALSSQTDGPERTAARLLAWLASTEQRWLVVLDDLAGPGDIRDLWPPDQPNGRTVVTTRRRDADLVAGRNLVEVTVFSEAEAVEYLTRKLRDLPHLADDVLGVVTDLDALPLALSHAAAYMIDLDLPCTHYRTRFADRSRRLPELFPDGATLYDGYNRTVATTWTLSIEAAERLRPLGIARPLLAIVSSLNPNGIPEEVFAAPTSQSYLADQLASRPSWADIRDGLRGLHRFHLATHTNGIVRIHALVQRAVREELGDAQSTAVARAAANALLEIWPTADTSTGELFRANAMALQDNWPAAIWDPARGIHPIMTRTIASLGSAVQLSEAIRLCRQLTRQATETLGPRHLDTFVLRDQLAVWLGDAGQTEEAITNLGALVVDVATTLGRDHPLAIAARKNLAYQWGQAGHPTQAIAELASVLDDERRLFGPEDGTVLTTRHQLVYFRYKAGDTATAVAELSDVVRLATRIHGPEHRETLEVRGLLAFHRANVVGHVQSVVEMRQVLDDMCRVLGPASRDVSVLRNNLAMRQWQAGDIATAAASFGKLLAERVESHGRYHRDTAATRHRLSRVLADMGRRSEAASELDEVIEGYRRLYGPAHPDTLRCRYELAVLHDLMGHHRQAAAALDGLLDDQLRILGDSHPSVADTRAALAHAHDKLRLSAPPGENPG